VSTENKWRRSQITATIVFVNKQDEIPPGRNYRWPWFVLAAVLLFVALTIVWMSFAVKRERQERDFSTPIPTGAK
jgi:hypothetical protein